MEEMKMKKLIALCLALILLLAAAGCASGNTNTSTGTDTNTNTGSDSGAASEPDTGTGLRAPVSGDKYKFGIVLMVENGAFLDMKQGIIDGLAANGLVDGENCTVNYQCAQGDATNLNTICQSMANGSYDIVFTVATPPTQAFVNLESSTPNIFCSVAAPVAAGVLSDMNAPDHNATGTSNAVPAGSILEMGLTMTPGIETFGLLYCTSEVNAVNAMENARAYLDASGLKYEEVTVANSGEVQQAAESLMGKVDALFVANDSVVQSAVTLVSDLCRENGIPSYCCSATTVQSGLLATLAMSDISIGLQTAEMAMLYLRGADIAAIPCQVVPADIVSVNSDAVAALGITVPDTIAGSYGEIQYLTDVQ